MSQIKPYLSMARVTLQLVSPLLIATGQSADGFDANIIRDANNLPMIPGTSLAGVLAHLAQQFDPDLYGIFGDRENRSDLRVSAAVVHNSRNQVCEGLLFNAEEDSLLDFLIQDEPFSRDRVALNIRGVSVDKGKYDFIAVPAGVRFTFELRLQTESNHFLGDNNLWDRLLKLLYSAQFRLGQKTRSGLGQIMIQQCHVISLDLMDSKAQKDFAKLSKLLGDSDDMVPYSPKQHNQEQHNQEQKNLQQVESYELKVKAESGLRVGQGRHQFDSNRPDAQKVDALIWSEPRIEWPSQDQAVIKNHQVVIPASGIKGAILHRTVFHYHRLKQNYIPDNPDGRVQEAGHMELPDELQKLFGVVAKDKQETGLVGKLYIDDIVLDKHSVKTMICQHNSIDRFTQGTRDSVLFAEEVLWQPEFSIYIRLEQCDSIPEKCKQALKCALDDIVNGNLAIGAGSSKGHGFLIGERINAN